MVHPFADDHGGAASESSTVLLILGMRNNSCREDVCAALEAVPCVIEVSVSLYRGLAVIKHAPSCDTRQLVAAVTQAGYGASITKLKSTSGLLSSENLGLESDAPPEA